MINTYKANDYILNTLVQRWEMLICMETSVKAPIKNGTER